LDATHRDAIPVTLGFGGGQPLDRPVVSNAALAVLQAASEEAEGDVLVIVDDLRWWEMPWWERQFPRALVTSCGVSGDRGEELDHCGGEFFGALDMAQMPCPAKDGEL
jgi:hypothetical protein